MKWFRHLMILMIGLAGLLASSSVFAIIVCLQQPDGPIDARTARSCDLCILNVVRGEIYNKIKDDHDPIVEHISVSRHDRGTASDGRIRQGLFYSNANQPLFITGGSFSNTPIMATEGSVILRNGAKVDFLNCAVKSPDPIETNPPGDCPANLDRMPAPGDNIAEGCFRVSAPDNDTVTTKQFNVITGKSGRMLYGCSKQSVSPGVASSDINVQIYIDGLVTEFRCNVEAVLGVLFKYTQRLFFLLFTLDFLWGAVAWVVGGGRDLQNFLKNIIRKLMFFGFFMYLMQISEPTTAFFSTGSWVGQTLLSMINFGLELIDPASGTSLLTQVPTGSISNTDILKSVADDTLFMRDVQDAKLPAAAGAQIIGISPAKVMIYGFHLMGAIISAMIQGVLFNMPAIIGGVVAGILTGGVVLTWVIRFLMLFLWVGLTTAFMAMMTMIIIGGQMFIAFIEMYTVCGLALVFMGFGGSRWTVDNVMKYFSYVFVSGLKILSLMIMMVIAILITHGWVNRLMSLAGGGQDIGSAILDFMNPLNIVLRMIEAMLLYVSLYIQARILAALAIKSADFMIGFMGGSPVLSGGQVLAAAAAAGGLASHGANSMIRLGSHALSIAGNAGSNLTSLMKGIGQGFGAAREAASAEADGGGALPPPSEAGGHGAAGGGRLPPPSGASGAPVRNRDIAKAAMGIEKKDASETGVLSKNIFGSNKEFGDRNVAQKGTSLAKGAIVGAGAVSVGAAKVIFSKPAQKAALGAGVALGVGVAAGGGAAAGVGLVLAAGATHAPQASKAVGGAIGKGAAKGLMKMGLVKPKSPAARAATAEEEKPKQMDGVHLGDLAHKALGGAAHKDATDPTRNQKAVGKAKKVGTVVGRGIAAYFTLGLSEVAIRRHKNKAPTEERGQNAEKGGKAGSLKARAAENARGAMTAPVAGAWAGMAGIGVGAYRKVIKGGSFKQGFSETSSKTFASSMSIGKDSMQKRGKLAFKENIEPLAGGTLSMKKHQHQMKEDFTSTFGQEVSIKKHKNGEVSKIEDMGKAGVKVTLSEAQGGGTLTLKPHNIAGEAGFKDHETGQLFLLDTGSKKLTTVELKQGDKKAYQTLLDELHGAEGVKGKIAIMGTTGTLATMDLTFDTMRGLGAMLKGQTSEQGFFGKQAKSAMVLVKWTGDPRFADRPAEGFTFAFGTSAPDDSD